MRPHRIFSAVITALALTLALGTTDGRAAYDDKEGYDPSLGLARISYMTGDVLYYSPETDEWAAASPNFALREQDSLWIGDDSKAEVRFAAGETAWMNYQTGLDILHMKDDDNGQTYQVGLPSGEASFYVKNFDTLGSVFQVDTPTASARAFGKAYFRVNSMDDGTTQVGVREGSVEVESEYGVLTLRPGDLMEVYPSGRPRVMELPAKDSWDDWVDARLDRYTKKYASARYLPPRMQSYDYEFDEYGSWVSYPDYGYVWVPRVSVGWSPYSYGRWVYCGYDYVWLPYDPWYAPYHYGRWYWDVSFGWFWIPPVVGVSFWSPGYVGWCYGPDYLYWVPLGPGEIYYGYGYYGPRSVNIFVHKDVRIKNVYINSRFSNSVVAVSRHDFREGRFHRAEIRNRDNPFRHKLRDVRVTGHMPVHEIKPDRQLRFPKPDVRVTERSKPPRRVMDRVKIVKERRLVTDTRGSAFNAGKRPERLRDVEQSGRMPRWKNQEEKARTRERPETGGRGSAVERGRETAPSTPGVKGGERGGARPDRWQQLREERPGAAERGRSGVREKTGGAFGREGIQRGEGAGAAEGGARPRIGGRVGGAPAGEGALRRESPGAAERGKAGAQERTGGAFGREGVQQGTTPETETGTGRQGGKIYRETGSDRGSLRREEGRGGGESTVREPAGTRQGDSGKTGPAQGRGGGESTVSEPAGTRMDNSGKAGPAQGRGGREGAVREPAGTRLDNTGKTGTAPWGGSGKSTVREPAGTRMDNSRKTGPANERTFGSPSGEKGPVEKLQPAVRKGAGGDIGSEPVEKGSPAATERPSNTKVRGSSKKRPDAGAADESSGESEPGTEERSVPGKGRGRGGSRR